MQDGDVGGIIRDAMMLTLKLGGPMLIATLAIGIVMSLIQAVAQINEPALAFVPKLLALGVTFLLGGSFMFASLDDFTKLVFDRIVAVGAR